MASLGDPVDRPAGVAVNARERVPVVPVFVVRPAGVVGLVGSMLPGPAPLTLEAILGRGVSPGRASIEPPER